VNRLRLLVLTPYLPWPLLSGANLRMYASLRALSRFADLTLACTYYNFSEVINSVGLKNICQSTIMARHAPAVGVPTQPAEISMRTSRYMVEFLKQRNLPDEFDAVHVHFPFLGEYVELCAARHPGLPIVYEAHNIEYDLLDRSGQIAERDAMRRYEEQVWRTAAHCIAVTERDRQMMAEVLPQERLSLLPNGVDCSHYTPQPAKPEVRLVFIGCLAHPPNTNAVAYFLKHIWPRIRQNGLPFEIIGSGSPAPLSPYLDGESGISLHTNVPDERPYLDFNSIVVVPLWSGGGSRIKILTALAMGCPVVSTTVGAEGLDLENGRHLLIADTPETIQVAIERLQSDEQLRQELGRQGRQRIVEAYDWSNTLAPMQKIYGLLIG
jgi:glycosyltransferase involved in cell wall biosynthesis